MSETFTLDESSLGDPVEDSSRRTCTYSGCEEIATVIFGGRAKVPNRCVDHGPQTGEVRAPRAKTTNNKRTGTTAMRAQLMASFGTVGAVTCAFDMFDGQVILSNAEALATALDHLAQQNPAVRRVLQAAMTGGAGLEVAFVVAAILVPIAAHHGALPEQLTNFKMPRIPEG